MAKKQKAKFRKGQRVILPDVKGLRFAGLPMQQDKRYINRKGTIIGIEKIWGVESPLIRLDGGTRPIVHGYECWWRLLKEPANE